MVPITPEIHPGHWNASSPLISNHAGTPGRPGLHRSTRTTHPGCATRTGRDPYAVFAAFGGTTGRRGERADRHIPAAAGQTHRDRPGRRVFCSHPSHDRGAV